MKRSKFTQELHSWIGQHKWTLDTNYHIKLKAIEMLNALYPEHEGAFQLDVQFYTDGEYSIIPRNLITGAALCDVQLPKTADAFSDTILDSEGIYKFDGKNLIFSPYIKPVGVFIDMIIR